MHLLFLPKFRLVIPAIATAWILAWLPGPNTAWAQTPTPTPEQMEAFQNLTPEQQQAILESMGQGGSGSTTTSRDGVRRDRDLTSPETVRPKDSDETDERDAEDGTRTEDELTLRELQRLQEEGDLRPREPRIRANDSILLNARFKLLDPVQERARTVEDKKRLDQLLERVLRGNPYKLDASGMLRIPGVPPIALSD